VAAKAELAAAVAELAMVAEQVGPALILEALRPLYPAKLAAMAAAVEQIQAAVVVVVSKFHQLADQAVPELL
jgi:hypothetical protein